MSPSAYAQISNTTTPIVSTLVGTSSILLSKRHILPILISLELILVSIAALNTANESTNTETTLIIILVIIIEGATGLSILIKTAKTNGNDLIEASLI